MLIKLNLKFDNERSNNCVTLYIFLIYHYGHFDVDNTFTYISRDVFFYLVFQIWKGTFTHTSIYIWVRTEYMFK